MEDPRPEVIAIKVGTNTPAQPPTMALMSLVPPSPKKKRKSGRTLRILHSIIRSFPIITSAPCKFPPLSGGLLDPHRVASSKFTGTLFGYRKGRVSLSLQENSRCLPTLVIQLAMEMSVLQKDLSSEMVRISLECEKQTDESGNKEKTKLMEESLWTMYYNGRKMGYGIKREATQQDIHVMELLKAVSMGAGLLPPRITLTDQELDDEGEITYMRTQFQHVAASKHSQTLCMLSPEGNAAPELTIFMVRL